MFQLYTRVSVYMSFNQLEEDIAENNVRMQWHLIKAGDFLARILERICSFVHICRL